MRFNENNEIIQNEEYKGILVGLSVSEDIENSMEELAGLAEAAGICVLGQLTQNLERPDKATRIGKGKVEELREMCENMEADMVIFNDELSGAQLRNLEQKVGVRVIDRTILILDIFAGRAVSGEGKLQVELAQLKYRLPRLTGFGKALSRLGGGIGTRGPGEKKLETDRRHITRRIEDIKEELRRLKSGRQTRRTQREKAEVPVVALVGYTNSGKSAIMNRLLQIHDKEEKSVFEENMLFATLDTAQRGIKLEGGKEFVLIDTVGFVSKLPHALIDAFKGTLEEALQADLLLHVVDASEETCDFQIQVTNRVLGEIGAADKEKLLVYNKMDRAGEKPLPGGIEESVFVSAKTGENFDMLINKIKEKVFLSRVKTHLLIPYSRGDISSYLCEKAKVISMEYMENGTLFHGELSQADYNRLKSYEQI